MISTKQFGEALKKSGFDFYSGVPCSFLKDLINYAINECEFVMAANEGQAVAISAGAYLGGRKSVFLCQNSGLTNASSPLTSLNAIFKIPVLGFVSLRGEEGIGDEPQHELMGKITSAMLDTMKIKWEYLSGDLEEALIQLERANQTIAGQESFFFIVRKDTFEKETLKPKPQLINQNLVKNISLQEKQFPKRFSLLEKLNQFKDQKTVFIATTGFTGRELYESGDTPHNFYVVGSMGCANSIGLGLALTQAQKDVIVIEGDGALLMQLGSLATNAYYHPKNLLHILLDNNAHESTGGQSTVSHTVNFADIAAGAGYTNVFECSQEDELVQAVKNWKINPQLTFISIKISQGTKENLGRPKIKPFEVKERLMKFLSQ